MRIPFIVVLLICVPCATYPAAFQNLNFDSANTNNVALLPNTLDLFGTVSDLLPGWQLSHGPFRFELIGFNIAPNPPNATLIGADDAYRRPIEGLDSVAFYSDREPNPVTGTLVPFSLRQVGDVPTEAKSIHFLNYGFSEVELLINGSQVPLLFDGGFDHSQIHLINAEADISAYAGQTVELRFTTTDSDLAGLDSIYFSNEPVPEPSVLALLGVGAMLLFWRFCRRSRSY